MTVEENIMFPMQMFTKKENEEIRERANEVIERVNLINANEKYPDEISGGMKKRVAIARAIVMNPKYLFCDEPNSGLDPKTAILIDNLINEITEEYNITTVINTHDMNSVMEIGEKIVFLLNGKKLGKEQRKIYLILKIKLFQTLCTHQIFSKSTRNVFKKIISDWNNFYMRAKKI